MSFERMRIARIGIVAISLLCGAIPSAVGQVMPPPSEPLPLPDLSGLRITPAQARTSEQFFVVFDADDDGCIDRSEWRRRIMAIFYALDTEGTMEPAIVGVRGDEHLSRSEIPGLSDDLFVAADLDRDGRLSGYEFNQAPWTRFEAANPGIVDCLDIQVFTHFLEGLRPQ